MGKKSLKKREVKQIMRKMKTIVSSDMNEILKLQLLFGIVCENEVDLKKGEDKNFEKAMEYKSHGNIFYTKQNYKFALNSYNLGIVKCPQHTAEGRELLSKLLANRSSVFFVLKKYKKVIKDIIAVEKLGCYPTNLTHKLEWRKERSSKALMELNTIDENYDETLKFLVENDIITEAQRKEKNQEFEKFKKENKIKKHQLDILEDVEDFVGGKKYVAAHPAVDIAYDKKTGRNAVAKEDIPIGTIILKEEAHVAILTKNKSLENCQHCLASTDQPLSCPNCANVIFCSTACQKIALDSYHGLECKMFDTIREYGTNVFLVLRMFTQRGFSFFFDQREKLSKYLADKRPLGVPQKDVYHHDDFDNVMFLFRKDRHSDEFDVFVYYSTVCSIRLLRLMNFFPSSNERKILTDKEIFIAQLFLRNCRIAHFNVHAINEIKPTETKMLIKHGLKSFYEMVRLGIGLFPTLSFFNHSCDPSVVRVNKDRHIILRTIKPIRAGDKIHDNYGHHYMWTDKRRRQKSLNWSYRFNCKCIACEENWPCVENLQAEYKVPCRNRRCNYIMNITMSNPKPTRCSSCHRKIHPDVIENIMKPINMKLAEAEQYYDKHQYEKAMKIFIELLNLMFKYTNKPDLLIAKVQDYIEVCQSHSGNRSIDYY